MAVTELGVPLMIPAIMGTQEDENLAVDREKYF